jgi:hypothetical protein
MTAPNSIVWVVNVGGHAYDDAKRFGELKPVTQGRINVFSVDNLVSAVRTKLAGEATQEDYVLVSGYSTVNAIVIHFFLKKYKFCKLLIWDAREFKYKALTLLDFETS